MKNQEFDAAYAAMVRAYPDATNGDLVRILHRSDRGRFSYWFKFAVFCFLRWFVIMACFALSTSEVGKYIGHVEKVEIWGLVGLMLASVHWWVWLDLVNCILCYYGYRADPSGGDIFELLEWGTYKRCSLRVVHYLVWTLAFPALSFAYLYFTR